MSPSFNALVYCGCPWLISRSANLVASPDAVVLPDGSILGYRPPQLPDRKTAPPKPVPAPS